jgi:predicted DsbA family dithiol-disulfide isomerase
MPTCSIEVAADYVELQKFGVGATPTFFINGRWMAGAQPVENFEALIDEELAKARQRIAAGAKAASYYKDWVLAQGLTQLAP